MEHNISAIWPGWEIAATLGSGTSGTVYEIRKQDRGSMERSALKIISIPRSFRELEELYDDGHDQQTLAAHFKQQCDDIVREYRLMGERKSGSNLVAVEEVKTAPHADGVGWDIHIRMELLIPLHKTTGETSVEEEAVKLGMNICHALTVCNELGIVHRDIKPSNIFLSPDGTYKLGDHGLGKYATASQERTTIGLVRFMPPEFYLDKPFGAGADTYQVGLVMYWLLNKRRGPFVPLPPERSSLQHESEAVRRIITGEPLPRPIIGSQRLSAIVLKACSFYVEQRYQSPEKMLDDLLAVRSDAMSDGVIRGVMSSVMGPGAVYLGKDDGEEDQVNNATFGLFHMPREEEDDSPNNKTIRVESKHILPPVEPVMPPETKAEPAEKKRKGMPLWGKILLIVAAVILVLSLIFGTVTILAVSGVFDGLFFEDRDDGNYGSDDGNWDDSGSDAVSWSDWALALPDFVFDGHYAVETMLQYRSAPLHCFEGTVEDGYTVCYTGYTEWGEPGAWQDEPMADSELVQVEVGARYRYRDLYSYKYSEGFVTKTGYAWGEWKYSDTPVQARSGREIEEIPIYRCRTRLITYFCAKNDEWGEWGDEVLHPTQLTVVNTRTLYRYTRSNIGVATMNHFPGTIPSYVSRFVDVPNDSWYGAGTDNWVGTAVELGAMSADEYLCFRPMDQATVAEVIRAAVALRLTYSGGCTVLKETSPWYDAYVTYALQYGIINSGDFSDYTRLATREEAAYILSRALPEKEVSGTNLVTAILDMSPNSKYYMSVYRLAQAGVISWSAPEGYFKPQDMITRAEIAAMVSRIAYPQKRIVSDGQ